MEKNERAQRTVLVEGREEPGRQIHQRVRSITRWLIRDRLQVRTTQTLQFILAAAIRSLAGSSDRGGRESRGLLQCAGLSAAGAGMVGGRLARCAGRSAGGVLLDQPGAQQDFELALRSANGTRAMLTVLLMAASSGVQQQALAVQRRCCSCPSSCLHCWSTAHAGCRRAGLPRSPWAWPRSVPSWLRVQGAVRRDGSLQPHGPGAGLPGSPQQR